MFESIILGMVQGIAEWLPVSSEGLIFLIKANFFAGEESAAEIIRLILFLHLGTFLAALIYFRKEVWILLKTLANYGRAASGAKKILNFLLISTLISGVLGFALVKIFSGVEEKVENTSRFITLAVGLLLLLTAVLQFGVRAYGKKAIKRSDDLKNKDGIILGFVQGFSVLPGLSRSGLTIAAFLFARFDDFTALRLSFLMSLPIVLAGNIILNFDKFVLNWSCLSGLLASFVFGLLSIDLLLRLAKKVNFAVFVLIFAIITLISAFFY